MAFEVVTGKVCGIEHGKYVRVKLDGVGGIYGTINQRDLADDEIKKDTRRFAYGDSIEAVVVSDKEPDNLKLSVSKLERLRKQEARDKAAREAWLADAPNRAALAAAEQARLQAQKLNGGVQAQEAPNKKCMSPAEAKKRKALVREVRKDSKRKMKIVVWATVIKLSLCAAMLIIVLNRCQHNQNGEPPAVVYPVTGLQEPINVSTNGGVVLWDGHTLTIVESAPGGVTEITHPETGEVVTFISSDSRMLEEGGIDFDNLWRHSSGVHIPFNQTER